MANKILAALAGLIANGEEMKMTCDVGCGVTASTDGFAITLKSVDADGRENVIKLDETAWRRMLKWAREGR